MKVLRVILIIVVILVAAVLIVPLFSPATAEVSSEITIERDASSIFPSVASFKDRPLWDRKGKLYVVSTKCTFGTTDLV